MKGSFLVKMHTYLGLIAVAVLFSTANAAMPGGGYTGDGGVALDVPYVPTPPELVTRMLELAHTRADDIHYDLGSGDGRIVVAAARDFHVKKGVGVDLDPLRIAEANENAKKSGVSDRVTFHRGDLFQMDFKEASVLTMYLLPAINLQLRPKILSEMRPGSRVVSHSFTMDDWEPDAHEVVDGRNIYLWIIPAKVAGTWQWQIGNQTYSATLSQQYQVATGELLAGGAKAAIVQSVINGENISFEATLPGAQTMQFTGKVNGNSIDAIVNVGGKSTPVTAKKI